MPHLLRTLSFVRGKPFGYGREVRMPSCNQSLRPRFRVEMLKQLGPNTGQKHLSNMPHQNLRGMGSGSSSRGAFATPSSCGQPSTAHLRRKPSAPNQRPSTSSLTQRRPRSARNRHPPLSWCDCGICAVSTSRATASNTRPLARVGRPARGGSLRSGRSDISGAVRHAVWEVSPSWPLFALVQYARYYCPSGPNSVKRDSFGEGGFHWVALVGLGWLSVGFLVGATVWEGMEGVDNYQD
jgi:hypothetical protein